MTSTYCDFCRGSLDSNFVSFTEPETRDVLSSGIRVVTYCSRLKKKMTFAVQVVDKGGVQDLCESCFKSILIDALKTDVVSEEESSAGRNA